jgi:hypothetical protein
LQLVGVAGFLACLLLFSDRLMKHLFQSRRRTRVLLHRATGLLALFVWLFLFTAEICPPLHAWLHGGSIPDDDDCPIVAVAVGHVHVGVSEIQPAVSIALIEITPRAEVAVFVPSEKVLPNERAPPVASV